MRCIPNLIISAPMDEIELRNLMFTAQLENKGPFSIRYPRGRGVIPDWKKPFEEIQIGKGRIIRKGSDIAILSIGHIGNIVTEAAKILDKQHIDIAHYDMRFVKPIDEEILHEVAKKFKIVLTIEDASTIGGFGSAVTEFINDNGYNIIVKRLGIPDKFIDHGSPQELYKECGLDAESIAETVKRLIQPNILSHTG